MQLLSEDVRVRVLNALHWDLAVPRDRLNVDVENGWVTVSGMVDLPYQRTCAEFDAQKRSGRRRRHQPDPPGGRSSGEPRARGAQSRH